jgi:RNA polymerase sigma-70 factor (ECF subfamily)
MGSTIDDDVKKAKTGDRNALNRLLARNQERLSRMVRDQLGGGLRARVRTSDLLQSTYLDVIRGVKEFGGETEEAFLSWVGTIVEHNVLDRARYHGASKRAAEKEVSEGAARNAAATEPSPSSKVAFTDDLLVVHRALDGLPPEYRQVIELKLIEGLTHEEVAARLNRTPLATRTLLARAKSALLFEIDRIRGGEG